MRPTDKTRLEPAQAMALLFVLAIASWAIVGGLAWVASGIFARIIGG